jgi:hypothetical protein
MASIATFNVTVFRGLMPRARRRYRLRSHDGVDGDGVVFDAWHCGTVDITTRILATAAQASALREQYRAQQGRHVTVIDQFAETYDQVLVVDVIVQPEIVIGDNRHVVAIWTLLPQSQPPAGAL